MAARRVRALNECNIFQARWLLGRALGGGRLVAAIVMAIAAVAAAATIPVPAGLVLVALWPTPSRRTPS